MAGTIDTRLKELNITLPAAPAPAANYVPYSIVGSLVFVAGQVPFIDGKIARTGKVGVDLTVQEGAEIARICALNIIAQVKAATEGDLDRVVKCVKLGGFVNSAPNFTQHPEVVNGASDLMVAIFGDAGRHARFAVGAPSLPRDVPVEVDAIFEIKPA